MRLPTLTSRKVVRALKKAGFYEARQTGSHLFLVKHDGDSKLIVSVPIHAKDIKRSLLFEIIRQANLTVEQFLTLL